MRGQVLGVDPVSRQGQITGDDGQRYTFRPDDWSDLTDPSIGARVDFESDERRALNVFRLSEAGQAVSSASSRMAVVPVTDRNRVIAALLAFFVGTLGLHRFYLGRKGSAIAMLVLSITVIGLVISAPWALVDSIQYLMMSEEEFAARYPRRHEAVALGNDGQAVSLPGR